VVNRCFRCRNLDLALTPGTKLGLLGTNGSGKSTLLRVLAGAIAPDAGTVVRAEGLARSCSSRAGPARAVGAVTAGALPQRRYGGLSRAPTARGGLGEAVPLSARAAGRCRSATCRRRAGAHLHRPAHAAAGRRAAARRATNDLDIPALEVLEESLAEFPGALVVVSHDRDLLDRLCTEVVGLDGRGGAALYGSVGQWLLAYERAAETTAKLLEKPAAPAARGPRQPPSRAS